MIMIQFDSMIWSESMIRGQTGGLANPLSPSSFVGARMVFNEVPFPWHQICTSRTRLVTNGLMQGEQGETKNGNELKEWDQTWPTAGQNISPVTLRYFPPASWNILSKWPIASGKLCLAKKLPTERRNFWAQRSITSVKCIPRIASHSQLIQPYWWVFPVVLLKRNRCAESKSPAARKGQKP